MALKTNLISYWKLDESSGNAADAHGSNTLTNTNTATFSSSPAKINNAAQLVRASNQYFGITDGSENPTIDFTSPFSVSAWVYFTSTPTSGNWHAICGEWKNVSGGWAFVVYNNSGTVKLLLLSGTDSTTNATNWSPSTSTWYHVVVTFTDAASGLQFYVNGAAQGGAITPAAVTNANAGFAIGSNAGSDGNPGDSWDGAIDEVAIWSRAITSSEVTEIYNGGSGLSYDSWDTGGGGGAATSTNHWLLMGV